MRDRAKYNIQTVSFLIGSLNNVVQTFGSNSKSVAFYKQQVNSLVNIGQVSGADANFVFRLTGMENTDAVKWDLMTPRLDEFINCMNYLCNVELNSNEKILNMMMALRTNEVMTDKSEKYIRELYGLESNQATLPLKGNAFGTINVIQNPVDSRKTNAMNEVDKFIELLMTAARKNKASNATPCLRIKNLEAVCSCDVSYYTIEIGGNSQKLLKELIKYTNKLNSLVFMSASIVKSDGCSSYISYIDDKYTTEQLRDRIDFDKLKRGLKEYKKYLEEK